MRAAPRMLLLQARTPGDPMLAHETRCFVDTLGVDPDTLSTHDLTTGPPAITKATRFDAVFIGGSGEFSVCKVNLPQQEAYLELLRELVARQRPMFCSCFGYHGLVRALGGEVSTDTARMEVGTYELRCSEEAADDALFGALPRRFMAQLGHKDLVTRPPEALINLASSELSPYQALRVPQAPIWAVQFHPELDYRTNLERFEYYIEQQAGYGDSAEAEAIRSRFRESPEASSLLRAFVELVLG